MNIRFYNAKLLPLDGDTAVTAGELHVVGSTVAYLGDTPPKSRAIPWDREIDCRGGVLLPGFKNAHTHSGMTFLRSFADDLPLDRWLHEAVFPYEAKLTPDDILWLTKLAILEYVSGGVTAMFDMYYFRDAIAEAGIDMGFRTVLVGCANDFGGTAAGTADEFRRFNRLHPLVSAQLGFHAEYTTSRPLLNDLAAMVQSLRMPFWSHMNETLGEVESCISRNGVRPFELLDSLGLFDFGGGGYHCVHLSENELAIMQRRGLTAVTCPASNLKLGSGVAPVCEFLDRGIPVAIGTDGPASNNCLDMFREMFLVTGLQKVRRGADACAAGEVLRMACGNGARAMGLMDCDALAVGKQADLVLLDCKQPNMQPEHNIAKNIVYSGNKQNVRLTMIAGEVVYENGEYPRCDPGKIYAKCARITKRICG